MTLTGIFEFWNTAKGLGQEVFFEKYILPHFLQASKIWLFQSYIFFLN